MDVKIGVIGGSGIGNVLAGEGQTFRREMETPFGKPADAIIETNWSGVPVYLLARHGPGHLLNPSAVPYRANIFALKQLGVTHVIATGAVGSLREEFKPRDLVIADQVIDKTVSRAGTFYEKSAVHVEFAEPFCPALRRILREAASEAQVTAHDRATYVAMEGPAFSTRAESLMHRLWGGDLIGMTAMPEAKLAREAELPYALLALVTDYDCWRPPVPPEEGETTLPFDPQTLLAEIIGNLEAASANAIAVLKRAVERIAADPSSVAECPAKDALKLAIWSDKSAIDAAEIERLRPLWGKYFA